MRLFFYMLYLLPITREAMTKNLGPLAPREVFLIIFWKLPILVEKMTESPLFSAVHLVIENRYLVT